MEPESQKKVTSVKFGDFYIFVVFQQIQVTCKFGIFNNFNAFFLAEVRMKLV